MVKLYSERDGRKRGDARNGGDGHPPLVAQRRGSGQTLKSNPPTHAYLLPEEQNNMSL
ncbi:MAG TPA: hypothetical protein ACHBX0_09300 [Arsenophonus sp.]